MEKFLSADLYTIIFSFFNLLLFFLIDSYKNKIFSRSLIDKPDNIRKFHNKPVYVIGGIFIAIYLLIILIYSYFNDQTNIFLISIISLAIFFIGLFDDFFSINAYKKIFFIFIIILIGLNFSNEINLQSLYFSTFNKSFELGNFSFLFTALCILLLVNALNLADGINGLAAGISIIWLFYAYTLANSYLQIVLLPLIFLLILLFTSIIREKIFLGDNGSLLISGFIGLIIIYIYNQNLYENSSKISAENIFILFMVPGIDMFRLFLERILKKRDPFSADRNHIHHLLIKRFSINTSLFFYFSVIIFFILLDRSKLIETINLIVIFIIFYTVIIIKLKKIEKKKLF
jgi:UDP-GlcNAc:undecaprenyl-phosphate GlcNAc-1-phosphate transferase